MEHSTMSAAPISCRKFSKGTALTKAQKGDLPAPIPEIGPHSGLNLWLLLELRGKREEESSLAGYGTVLQLRRTEILPKNWPRT